MPVDLKATVKQRQLAALRARRAKGYALVFVDYSYENVVYNIVFVDLLGKAVLDSAPAQQAARERLKNMVDPEVARQLKVVHTDWLRERGRLAKFIVGPSSCFFRGATTLDQIL